MSHCAACFEADVFAPCDCECHHENDRALERDVFALDQFADDGGKWDDRC